MSTLRREDSGEIAAIFTSQESQVLINLTEQLLELLGESSLHYQTPGESSDPLMNLLGISGNDAPPEDPVLRRLLPDGYQDRQEAAEFRRYTETGLRERKRAHAYLIREAIINSEDFSAEDSISQDVMALEGDEIRLAANLIQIRDEDANAWLGGLNDLRLALAVRLGIGDEFGRDQESSSERYELMVESDPMKAVYAVYSWLGWLQQSLLEVIMESGDEHQAT